MGQSYVTKNLERLNDEKNLNQQTRLETLALLETITPHYTSIDHL